MDLPAILVVIVLPLFVLFVMLEGRRQAKKYGAGSAKGQAMLRAGLMEVQNLLEPERKIEVVREAERKEELLVHVDEKAGPSARRSGDRS